MTHDCFNNTHLSLLDATSLCSGWWSIGQSGLDAEREKSSKKNIENENSKKISKENDPNFTEIVYEKTENSFDTRNFN